jgi:RNA recognition motif-containing protein
MESLPNAPAPRTDEERANDRHGRRDDFLSSRPDRGLPPREDLPLPTQPPYTAFVGNLAFDLTEMELEEFFGSPETKSIKIIKDRDDKPKGFGYIEFTKLEDLKDALAKSGSNFSGRTIRVSVAEPPKDRPGFAGGFDDDSKFESPWRRDGPLPDVSDSRDPSRRRFDIAPSGGPGMSEGASDWRSSRPPTIRPMDPEGPSFKRKTSGFATPDGQVGAADKEDVWTIGGKFKAASDDTGSRFGSLRGRGDMGPPKEISSNNDEGDWRSARPKSISRNSTSPTSSTPSTPQTSRRKLELFPRSATASAVSTPLSSPKITAVSGGSSSRFNPFGAAKPVDVSAREKEVEERLDKERESTKDRLPHPMSRTSSRTASERTLINRTRTPPPVSNTTSPPLTPPSPKPSAGAVSANVRPSVSFANVASAKRAAALERPEDEVKNNIAPQTAELAV